MMPTIHSKFSHDYRFLPELLMPIVTIDEVHNEATNSRVSKASRRKIQKEDVQTEFKITEKKCLATNENEKLTEPDNKKIKIEEHLENCEEPLLVPKEEKDINPKITESENLIMPINLKIKEEQKDSEEEIVSNIKDPVCDTNLMKSLEKVIEMARQKQTKSNILETISPEKPTQETISKPNEAVEKFNDNKVINQDDNLKSENIVIPIKKKRGRPRKNLDAKVVVKKEKTKLKKLKKQKTNTTNKSKEKKEKVDESDTPKYPCPICKGEEKRTEKQLRLHYKTEHGGRRLRTAMLSTEMVPCEVCGKSFRSSYHLKEHMETHNNYYNCEVCNSSHRKILDYVIHMRIHSEKGFFKCVFCPYITEEIVQITDHLSTSHTEFPQYFCKVCKKGFIMSSWFEEHDNFHTGLKPFGCDLCGKHFMYSRYLSAHRNFMHKEELGNINIHECVICHKQYQHRNSLKLHMNSHTGNFAICDVCGKILSSREKLKFHMRTHTGYKPFDCSYCGKCFTKKPILVEHIRIHTGERPYVCEYCTKAFSQRSSLVIHIRSHTGERPFVCHLCQKGFVAKAMLNIHLKACKGLIVYD